MVTTGRLFFFFLFFISFSWLLSGQNSSEPVIIITEVSFEAPNTTYTSFTRYFGHWENLHFSNEKALEKFCFEKRRLIEATNIFTSITIESEKLTETNYRLIITLVDRTPLEIAPIVSNSLFLGPRIGLSAIAPNLNNSFVSLGFNGAHVIPHYHGGYHLNKTGFLYEILASNIKAGAVFFDFSHFSGFYAHKIVDKGQENLIWRDWQHSFSARVSWPITGPMTLSSKLSYGYRWGREIIAQKSDYNNNDRHDIGLLTSFVVDYAEIEKAERHGFYGRLSYNFDWQALYNQSTKIQHQIDFTTSYYWAVAGRFYPSVRLAGLFAFGDPIYRFLQIRGIKNEEFRGNYALFASVDFRVKLFTIKKFLRVDLAPFVNYGVVFEHDKTFDRYNQGFGVGTDLILFLDAMPKTPISFIFGYDLRNKYANGSKRFFFDVALNFSY